MCFGSHRLPVVGLALAILLPACSSAPTHVPSDASVTDASAPDASADGAARESSAPQCVHDPAASNPIPATASDTLPTGACDASQAACDLVVRRECPCEQSSIRIYFHCACSAGEWDCVETDIDAATCTSIGAPGCPGDAGAAND